MRQNNLLNKLAERLDLHDEALPGASLVELIGNNRILIENHRGVRAFGEKQITVCLKCGLLCIYGQCLELRRMSGSQLIITGQIEQLTLLNREGK